ncbi:hypothetical protein GCM10027174_32740 [Salinifilum aidingensis]
MRTGVNEAVTVGRSSSLVTAFYLGLKSHRTPHSDLDAVAFALGYAAEDAHDQLMSFRAGVNGPPTSGIHKLTP